MQHRASGDRSIPAIGPTRRLDVGAIGPCQVAQTGAASELLGGRLVSVQDQFSPAFRVRREELEHGIKLDLACLPWRPLGGNAKGLAEGHSVIQQAADKTGTRVHQVRHPRKLAPAHAALPISGASRSANVRDYAAGADLELAADRFAHRSV